MQILPFNKTKELWNFLVIEQWKAIQKENRGKYEEGETLDYWTAFHLLWTAVALTVLEYYNGTNTIFYQWFHSLLPSGKYSPLYRHIYWSISSSFVYLFFPISAILLTPGLRIRDCGLSTRGFWKHLWIYFLLYLLVMLAVAIVSYSPSFQTTYPFYGQAHRSALDLILWWLFYGLQFFSLEFFFRGYLLHSTKKTLGVYSIFAAAIPYCMIHFGKPMPETLGAILAGTALGTLSLRTGSIWSGFLIHISVAYSMDFLSLWQKGKISIFPH